MCQTQLYKCIFGWFCRSILHKMSLIEGVGDEVTNFFIVMSLLLVGWLAWCSTSITDQPLIRTVLILRDRTPARIATIRANQQNTSNASQEAPSRPPNLETTEEETLETSVNNSDTQQSTSPDDVGKYSFLLVFPLHKCCFNLPFMSCGIRYE